MKERYGREGSGREKRARIVREGRGGVARGREGLGLQWSPTNF